ncbi:MAG: hypothetical protein WCR97_02640 [Bacilli bacterium]
MAKQIKQTPKTLTPYDKTYKVQPIKLMIIIVDRYQGDYYVEEFKKLGVSYLFITYGRGTVPSDLRHILSIDEDKKDIVFAFVKEDLMKDCLKVINERFNVSKVAKGISFSVPIDSMAGVLMYKFLTDTKSNRSIKNGK